MQLTHDRQITISIGQNRRDINWKPQVVTLSGLYEKMESPIRGAETQAEYDKLPKSQRDDLKDVGGVMAGTLSGGRRKASAVTGRDVATLDLDTIEPYGTETVINAVDALGCSYCIYSTRSHRPTKPRLRIFIPLDRTVTPDEYEPVARKLAEKIGIHRADPTTFEPSRLMYWPSCCADGEFIFRYADKPLASADSILGTYINWHDWMEWPQVPGSATNYQKLAVKQGDPESKTGIVGAFNRTYDVLKAMDELLPGIYAQCDNDPNRYTYLGGSTTGGAVVYDGGRFLFSHHATDPCSGKLVNAFDLVRLHKFGDLDAQSEESTPVTRLPSYSAMREFAVSNPEVAALMAQERREAAVADFQGVAANNPSAETNWESRLKTNPQSGAVAQTIDNVMIILDNDPLLKGKFALNEFAGRGEVLGALPWNVSDVRRLWSDTDNNGLYWYLERAYSVTKRGNIDAALDLHAATHSFNEVQDFLNGLTWDGVPRLDTLFIDYLGAEDGDYNRAVCRKAFTAAVARAMHPGCKFDNMLILCGPQGLGKSTLLEKMSRGWFNDSIRSFEGKEASELLQGVWLVEIAELDAFRRTDVARIKQFLSLLADRYRAAYGRHVSEKKRSCVFFGTCNEIQFLQDTTGNRRFWPVDVGRFPAKKSVFEHLDEDTISQIWAEAKTRWQIGEPLFLSGELENLAKQRQEEHREGSPNEGAIQEFVSRQVPSDWQRWSVDRRRDFWAGTVQGEIKLVERDKISAIEIWCELFNKAPADCQRHNSKELNAVLNMLPGWIPKKIRPGANYGSVNGFERKRDVL